MEEGTLIKKLHHFKGTLVIVKWIFYTVISKVIITIRNWLEMEGRKILTTKLLMVFLDVEINIKTGWLTTLTS